ncbi:hypothetical protein [Aggregatibacter kilianii]|uniref:hypothetical protein n=1 Tax=Aggregatibacter kilianii TaxID=2025884 RepID=UPI0013A62E7C|nr:hypothetical protein [Aggregatibacter kilianii]
MEKKLFKAGDVFFIGENKLGKQILTLDGGGRVGKLIYISEHFKNVIGFLPSVETFSSEPNEISNIHFMENVIYCGNSELINGKWKIIGHLPVSDFEIQLTTRIVANQVYVADNIIRLRTDEDLKTYYQQQIAGLGAVYTILDNLELYFKRKS